MAAHPSEHEPNRADLRKDPSRVSGMFDQVAPAYDRTNTVLSMGNDRFWRAATTRAVAPRPGEDTVGEAQLARNARARR